MESRWGEVSVSSSGSKLHEEKFVSICPSHAGFHVPAAANPVVVSLSH